MFAVIFVVIFLLHVPLLQLPYFWDEAGYYVPAARDLLLSGSLIPHTTVSNAHPPLVLAWIALWWKCVGYAPLVTRSAMLMVAAFSSAGSVSAGAARGEYAGRDCVDVVHGAVSGFLRAEFSGAGRSGGGGAHVLGIMCLSGGAQCGGRDLVLAGRACQRDRDSRTGGVGVLGDFAFGCAERRRLRRLWTDPGPGGRRDSKRILPLLFPLLPLALWYAYHYARTGYVFGNPEFFRYNVAATLNPLRFLLALVLRLWQAFGYMHLWVLTLGMLLAMLLPPVKDCRRPSARASRFRCRWCFWSS